MSAPNGERRPFTITKFETTPEGFHRARVTDAEGQTVECDDRWGSWQAAVRVRRGARTFRRAFVLPPVAEALQAKVPAGERTTTKREAVRS